MTLRPMFQSKRGMVTKVSVGSDNLADASITPAKMASGMPTYVDVQLSHDDLIHFVATPVELVPAPGAGLAVVVVGGYLVADTRAGAYTDVVGNASDLLAYYEGVDPDSPGNSTFFSTDTGTASGDFSFLDAGAIRTQYFQSAIGVFSDQRDRIPINKALMMKRSTSYVELTGGHAENTLSIRLYVVTVPGVPFGA